MAIVIRIYRETRSLTQWDPQGRAFIESTPVDRVAFEREGGSVSMITIPADLVSLDQVFLDQDVRQLAVIQRARDLTEEDLRGPIERSWLSPSILADAPTDIVGRDTASSGIEPVYAPTFTRMSPTDIPAMTTLCGLWHRR